MLSRFKKQAVEKWTELIHDGPRLETPNKESITMTYGRQKFLLSVDIAKFIKDYFRLKPNQQEDFKEKFIEELRTRINKIYPGKSIASLELNECSFVEHETTAPSTSKEVAETNRNHHDPTIILDGKLYKYTSGIDPSGFFYGRGESNPYSGCYRRRILPEDITINCSSWLHPDNEIHKHWGGVVCEPYASWLASWKDPVSNKLKYIFIPKNTELNQENDKQKYDAAFDLSRRIEEIRTDYWRILTETDNDSKLVHIAMVLYLVDHFSIRIGNPAEQRTFGACTLRKNHIKLLNGYHVQFDFPGKDSVRYCRTHELDPVIYNHLKFLLREHTKSYIDFRIFHLCNPGDINKYLQGFGDFSIKSFRTMNACLICNSMLQRDIIEMTIKEKLAHYNKACSYVAEVCNHQRKSPHGTLTYSVATGKGNYIDPRIVVSFCKRNGLSVGQCYSKALLEKNSWAIDEKSPWDVYY
jgi:DNA topoisomerase-1